MRCWQELVCCFCILFGLVVCDPWKLADYKLCKRVTIPGVLSDASGAAYANGSVIVVSNKPPKLVEIGMDGLTIASVPIVGFDDPEGIAWIPPNKLAIAEESFGGTLTYATYNTSAQEVELEVRYPLRVNNNRNTGIEAITYDERKDVFYMGVENDPRWVIEVPSDGSRFDYLFTVGTYINDLSGMYFEKDSQTLYLISQESQMVVRTSKLGSLLEMRPLEAQRPEGITFSDDGEVMFIVSEPSLLYIYAADGDCDSLDNV